MLTDLERTLYYRALGLDPRQINRTEEMRLASPVRKVGVGALRNSISRLASKLNGGSIRELESTSVELVCALEIEIFSDALEYQCQVPIKNIERVIEGRRHIRSATIDMMVYRQDAITLVECKGSDDLNRLAVEKPHDWSLDAGTWVHRPYAEWCRRMGYVFEVWSPPTPVALYQQNLMLLYSFVGEKSAHGESRAADALRSLLEERPLSVADALRSIPTLTLNTICLLLASRKIFGTLKSRPLENSEHFLLYSDLERSKQADEACLLGLRESLNQPDVDSKALLASTTDYVAGTRRLKRVTRMIDGLEPVTRRYRRLMDLVLASRKNGRSPLEACLTRYSDCGRRGPRLENSQIEAMESTARQYWDSGRYKFKRDVYFKLIDSCSAGQLQLPSEATFSKFLRRRSASKRAMNTGGLKAFHAAQDPVDPIHSSIPALAPGLMIHIDSTKFDQRVSTQVLEQLHFACPVLYVAIDSCTDKPIGSAVLFGHACQDMLMVLMRDIYFRQGRLPCWIRVDRGPDASSDAFRALCEALGISILISPTSDPTKNSPAENSLGRVNRLLSQRLLGSTEPDRQGRKVDNRFKSYNTACLLFKTIVGEIERCLFDDFANTPTANSIGSPYEKAEALAESVGFVGIDVPNLDNFRILTSVPLKRDIAPVGTVGYKHLDRMYRSSALSRMLAHSRADEIRRDCVDPTHLYVRFNNRWVSASSRDAVVLRARSTLDQLFATMMGRSIRATNRAIRNDIARARLTRIDLANASAPATEHLAEHATAAQQTNAKCDNEEMYSDIDDLIPYESEHVNG